MDKERRRLNRRRFSYYMRVMNERSGRLIGHLSDISTGGFRLDSQQAVPVNTDYAMRIDVPDEIGSKNFMMFVARSRWCQLDPLDNVSYNAGFQIVNMSPGDLEIFGRMFEKYGTDANKPATADYLWR